MKLEDELAKLTPTELQLLFRTASRSNQLFGKAIKELIYYPYKTVKIKLPKLLQNSELTQIITLFFKDKGNDIDKAKPSELFGFIVWIIDQLEAIYRLENDYLTQPPDMDLLNAGVSELNQFNELNVIDNLAGGDILKWKKIEKMPYHMVFDKLHKNAVETKISRNYNKIITDKHRTKK